MQGTSKETKEDCVVMNAWSLDEIGIRVTTKETLKAFVSHFSYETLPLLSASIFGSILKWELPKVCQIIEAEHGNATSHALMGQSTLK